MTRIRIRFGPIKGVPSYLPRGLAEMVLGFGFFWRSILWFGRRKIILHLHIMEMYEGIRYKNIMRLLLNLWTQGIR